MLQELSITNFAIIEHLDIAFEAGMTVLTGETGAGKSIIIDAVGLLAGGRGSSEFIRTGADKAILQGMFILPADGVTAQLLDEAGIEHADNTVILQREITKSGRNTCRINGMLVNTTTLKQIGETIVDIHGQNEHQELMQPEKHLGLLDEFATTKIRKLKQRYHQQYDRYQQLNRELRQKNANEKEWAQRLDMLNFQVDEIAAAQVKVGEEASLIAERDRLDNYQMINQALQQSYTLLAAGEETTGAVDMVGTAMNALEPIANLDSAFNEITVNVKNAFYGLQDAATQISNQLDLQEFDEGRLDEIEQRLDVLAQLKRKYGDSEQQILDYYQKIATELAKMTDSEENSEDLAQQVADLKQQLLATGASLSDKRRAAAKVLQRQIHQELKDLYMDKAIFEVRFKPTKGQIYRSGLDSVEFYIQTNPGERMRPLAKIASGGELSRMMLALKTIFSESQGITSIIFDEVDTGVSGRVAQAIAEKINGIAHFSQVLCITHLPQVAAMSDHHYFIAKKITGKRTKTSVTKLDNAARVQELARMLAGTKVTKLSLEHAEELLQLADEEKDR
ncbi:DNA repair protein RecN [Lactiplantibacillus paraplantarum]|uniref:DNA repair protein RecN n=1 Tax=Lactiplantibacillus paraplantarum TaxID=60520 RepID=A0AAD0X7Y3_9LACO|nr:DNA repair protein RecN [Lactiplantibacillus paraplantarum]AVW10265.1 DNA repair protein RecN [Lactiplantibacillus paraplantarum]AYJ38514.1 DNA repair protein RecN [Lactiplantibacillus paraplantarum]ERL43951.1 DNA repair protein RecN [Lactiplantibacillus paraplantarum]KRL51738.1 recN protein [Lactiplantibacillus paraplantarum DSM 10667]MCU4683591.1 DNA repair protein RecN [Lactiplantibacillus paraplantarum]